MSTAYIVIEGKENAQTLKQVLPMAWEQRLEVVAASDWSSAIASAATLMTRQSRPVILLVNAQSTSPEQVQESTRTIEQFLLPAATEEPYKVISVMPSIAQALAELSTLPSPSHHPLLKQIHQFVEEGVAIAV